VELNKIKKAIFHSHDSVISFVAREENVLPFENGEALAHHKISWTQKRQLLCCLL